MGMWAPPNPHGLPSKEEIEDTENAINILENRLQAAASARWRSGSKVKKLQRELDQRKAWIAPMRRIPYDILSLIFLEACQTDPMAPFILGGVCTSWRRSLLDTPRAWTFMQLNYLKTSDAMRMVLNRGAPYPLYLDIPSKTNVLPNRALEGHTERMRCLRMDISFSAILQHPFSNLTKLAIIGDKSGTFVKDPWKLLDGSKFPKLRGLSCGSLLDSLAGTLPPHTMVPPIEELHLTTWHPRFIARIIERLAPKLTLLYIFILTPKSSFDSDQPRDVHFPRLLELTIMQPLSWMRAPHWPFNAHTPALLSYKQAPAIPGYNIHKDTQTVTRLGFRLKIDLQFFPRLREVTSIPGGIHDLMGDLEEDPQRCPDLDTIHCKYEDDIEKRVKDFNATYGRNIRCNLTESWPPFLAAPYQSWVEFPGKYEF